MSSASTDPGSATPTVTGIREGTRPAALAVPELRVDRGVCYVLFAYDVGVSVDLDEAERRVYAATQRESIRRTRKAPRYFQYHPSPLRVTTTSPAIPLTQHATDSAVDYVIWDFGAVSVTYRIPVQGPLSDLLKLAQELFENETLLADSRRGVEHLLATIRPAVTKAQFGDVFEDYVIFQIASCSVAAPMGNSVADYALPLAQVLRAEPGPLAEQEIEDALSCRIAFGHEDLTIIDWNAALLIGPDMDDVLAVLEFANVELLEMRFLDDQLDAALTASYALFTRQHWSRLRSLRSRSADLRQIARMQVDGALLFEGVNNTLKLLGDPYLARVYRLAAQRLHLSDWDASILRKLETLESIYEKLSDQQSAWRMEVLEWIIIVLIAVSIVISMK